MYDVRTRLWQVTDQQLESLLNHRKRISLQLPSSSLPPSIHHLTSSSLSSSLHLSPPCICPSFTNSPRRPYIPAASTAPRRGCQVPKFNSSHLYLSSLSSLSPVYGWIEGIQRRGSERPGKYFTEGCRQISRTFLRMAESQALDFDKYKVEEEGREIEGAGRGEKGRKGEEGEVATLRCFCGQTEIQVDCPPDEGASYCHCGCHPLLRPLPPLNLSQKIQKSNAQNTRT